MKVCPIPDLEFESLFKDIRSAILLSISSSENNAEILATYVIGMHCSDVR